MDFFARQDTARRHTTLLVFYFLLAVLGIVVCVNVVSAIAFKAVAAKAVYGEAASVPGAFYAVVTLATLALIAGGSLVQIMSLAGGGAALARMMGARPVSRASSDPAERRLLNVVEEMAIASGTAVPQVFVMDEQAVDQRVRRGLLAQPGGRGGHARHARDDSTATNCRG